MLHVVPAGIVSFPSGGYVPAGALFFDGSADYMTWDPSGASSTPDRYCLSFWAKRSALIGGTNVNVIAGGTNGTEDILRYKTDAIEFTINGGGGGEIQTNALFRDTTAWHHVFVKYDSNASGGAGDRMQMFVNGAEITSFATDSNPSSGLDSNLLDGAIIAVGAYPDGSQNFSGYLVDLIVTDNGNESVTDFGEYDSDTGIWVPKDPSTLTFGGNSFWLAFDDASFATYGVGKDSSGRNNHFTPVSMGANNIVVDNCANSTTKQVTLYPSIDPSTQNGGTLSNNNLTYDVGGGSNYALGNFYVSSGKYYWEIILTQIGFTFGVAGAGTTHTGNGNGSITAMYDAANGQSKVNGSTASYTLAGSHSPADGQRGQVKLNLTDNEIEFGVNNNFGPALSITDTAYTTHFARNGANDNDDGTAVFAEADWTYSAPTGYTALTSTVTGVGNFCTWNEIDPFPSAKAQLSDGNTIAVMDADSAIRGTIFFDVTDTTGYYWETTFTANIGNASHVGIATASAPLNNTAYIASSPLIATYLSDGGADHKTSDRDSSSTHPTYTNYDTIGVAVKGGAIWFSKNGSWVDGANGGASSSTILSEINAGTTTNAFFTSMTGYYAPHIREHNGTNTTSTTNWGRKPFIYTPPTNMKKLMGANLPAPTITDPSAYFGALIWRGNSTDDTTVRDGETIDGQLVAGALKDIGGTGTRWTPDFAWIKERTDGSTSWVMADSVRGVTKNITSDSNAAQDDATRTTDFVAGGIEVGNSNFSNKNDKQHVGYFWRAGGAPSADNSGGASPTNNSIMIDGSANTSTLTTSDIYPKRASGSNIAKFGIVQYTGNGSGSAQTLANPFSWAPDYALFKNLAASDNWELFHSTLGSSDANASRMYLDLPTAATSQGVSRVSAVSANQITFVGSTSGCNPSSQDVIMYAWAKTPGMIGVGTYLGNGDANGTFVQVDDGASGFRPAWLMLKRVAGTENWYITDSLINKFNPASTHLLADSQNGDGSGSGTDFVANGFKVRASSNSVNASGETYIYLAFAEHPFGGGDDVAQGKAR